MDNNDKLALRESTTAIKCKLIIKAADALPQIILTESNCIKDWTYTDERYVPQQGFIGQFVARTLSGNLQNIDDDFNIENREVELQIGIVNRDENTENWYSMGNFLITNPEDDEVRDNTKFEAMDYAKLFNKTFDGDYTDNIFTVSYNAKMENKETVDALWLAKYTCAQVNVELGSTDFTNSDYEIDINPFRNNEPCRDVMKEISKLAYSWVRIGWDNKCYIDFDVKQESSVDQYDIFTNDHYYTLETKKEVYGPVNKVVVGMSNVDGESHAISDNPSIAANGEHAIYIYDNPLTYTFEHRERANEKGNVLFGLTYSHIKCETIGFPWLIGNELISISDMEGNIKYTYPFNKTITYTGHIKSNIDSMGESQIEETLSYESDVVRNARNALINVNKQEGSIQILSEKIEVVEKEINPTKTATGSDIYIEDASNNPLINLEIEGKSEQETRSGKNLLDYTKGFAFSGGEVTIEKDKIIFTTSTDCYGVVFPQITLKPNTTYTIYSDYIFTGTLSAWGYRIARNGTWSSLANNNLLVFTTDSTGIVQIAFYVGFPYTVANNILELSNIRLYEGSYTKDNIPKYEEYGASPSPDYPSEIESVGYENLAYDNWASNFVNVVNDSSKAQITTFQNKNTLKFHPSAGYGNYDNANFFSGIFKENTRYTFTLDFYSTANASNIVIEYTDGTKETLTNPPANTWKNYTLVSRANKTIKSLHPGYYTGYTYIDLDTIQIVEGTRTRSYVPKGKYGIEFETVGKNLLYFIRPTFGTIVENNDGSFNFSYPYAQNFSTDLTGKLKSGTYTLSNFGDITLYIQKNESDYTTSVLKNGGTKTFTYDGTSYLTLLYGATTPDVTQLFKLQLEKGSTATEYSPYQSNSLLIVLNEPLRSLPNGVKDVAYIKNNKLYVDRYIGSLILDGSETGWSKYKTLTENTIFQIPFTTGVPLTNDDKVYLSNNFNSINRNEFVANNDQIGISPNARGNASTYIIVGIPNSLATTVDAFKTWLSTHNTQVDYELAEPYTEELGEIEIPSTFKGVNNITTTDDLEPIINLTYVRDTIIADYVENHVAQLKITENEIKASVESVSSSVGGLSTTINRVEGITTDNSQVINVISTNIDQTTGEVREVTTTTGFTFNKDGMTIHDDSGFKAEHRADGTYYKDGASIVGQYTKDGSKQKDLQLFGVYSYGMRDKDDTPMFVAQLYNDENGEECFGHFYNRGGY